MTDLEISKALALAIGWNFDCMTLNTDAVRCYYPKQTAHDSSWRVFDYRDWNVISPIAEKYDCFPYRSITGGWVRRLGHHATPQKAIALAVIRTGRHDQLSATNAIRTNHDKRRNNGTGWTRKAEIAVTTSSR